MTKIRSIFNFIKRKPLIFIFSFLALFFILELWKSMKLNNSGCYSYAKIVEVKAAAYGRTSIEFEYYNKYENKILKGYSGSTLGYNNIHINDLYICIYNENNSKSYYIFLNKKVNDKDKDIKDKVSKSLIPEKQLMIN